MNKQIKFGVLLQYMQMALNILVHLIYTPIMLKVLGATEYGIYSLASSVISYLNILSLGFGASYIRFYAKSKASSDAQAVNRLNGLYLLVFSAMGVVSLAAGLFIVQNVELFFNETYTANDLHIARILMILLTFNLAISFPASVFVSYITSQEKFVFQKLVNMGKTVLSPCLSVAVLFLGYGSIGMAVITTAVSLVVDAVNIYYCIAKLKMRFTFKGMDCTQLGDIAKFSAFIAINQVIDQINWQTDKVILAKMMDAATVSVYAVASTINAMYISFSTSISSVFVPRVHRIVSGNQADADEQLTLLFKKVGRIQFFVLSLILTGFVFFGRYFILLWAGAEYEQAYITALLLICPVTISSVQTLGIEIQRAKNKHQFRSVVYLIIAVINVAVSIVLCRWFGIYGVAMGTTLALIVGNVVIMNIYYHRALRINILDFWRNILRSVPAIMIPVMFGVCMMFLYSFRGILDYGVLMFAYVVVYCVSVYVFGLDQSERNLIRSFVNGKRIK